MRRKLSIQNSWKRVERGDVDVWSVVLVFGWRNAKFSSEMVIEVHHHEYEWWDQAV